MCGSLFLDRELNPVASFRIGTPAEEYAYSVVLKGERIYVVGRTNFRGNWDGFVAGSSTWPGAF
ncbi:MAG: hypothetical protein Q9N34_03190 [Aquificota bacterium]|nr:hypothetical protein [Aquificota bacterium]